jgi:hypothetical protein
MVGNGGIRPGCRLGTLTAGVGPAKQGPSTAGKLSPSVQGGIHSVSLFAGPAPAISTACVVWLSFSDNQEEKYQGFHQILKYLL